MSVVPLHLPDEADDLPSADDKNSSEDSRRQEGEGMGERGLVKK